MQADEVRKSVRSYVTVFVALLACTLMTVAAARFHLAVPSAIAVALLIATVKGSMVAGVFMHLSNERRVIYATLVLTFVLLLGLLLLPALTHLDQINR
jgi:cytochrome c oxidase subunit IV